MKGSTASCTLVLMIGHSSPHSFSRCEANRRGTGICGRHKPSNVSLAAESFANPTDDDFLTPRSVAPAKSGSSSLTQTNHIDMMPVYMQKAI